MIIWKGKYDYLEGKFAITLCNTFITRNNKMKMLKPSVLKRTIPLILPTYETT